MAEEAAGDQENNADYSTEGRVQEPELRGGHFLGKAAEPIELSSRSRDDRCAYRE
jgi:hypothetical protein